MKPGQVVSVEKLQRRNKYLEKIIEDHLEPHLVEWDDVGFGDYHQCPICEAQTHGFVGPEKIEHKFGCYWRDEG